MDPLLASSTGNISEFNDWEAVEVLDLDVVDMLLGLAGLDPDLRLKDPLLASAGNKSEFNDEWETAEVLDFDLIASLLDAGLDPDLRLIDPLLALGLAGNNNEFSDWEASGVTAPSLADSGSPSDSS